MSQSPEKAVDQSEAQAYLSGYERMSQMLLAGASWSGREKNCAFLNTYAIDERFARIDAVSGLNFADDGRAVAQVDWDQDGDLDLWLVNRTGPTVRFMRNDAPGQSHFIRVRLRGETDNRDGIGARVKVYFAGGGAPLMRTVSAGRGYLSQSSKWVHFGLGDMGAIERVVVRWPSGDEQSFAGLRVDGWYEITQGQAQPKVWSPPSRRVALRAKHVEAPPASAIARVPLTVPQPMPGDLSFESAEGGSVTLDSLQGQPVLINLWATWCPPCIEELKEFASHSEALKATGVRIITLNVDGLGDARGAERAAIADKLKQLGWTFDSGYATEQTLMQLAAVRAKAFDYDRALVVPTSFLIDADGRLSAVYTGPVSAEQLIEDVKLTKLPIEILRDHTLPVQGRWFSPPREILTPELAPKRAMEKFAMAAALAKEGQVRAAYDAYMTGLSISPNADAYTEVGFLLGPVGELDAAAEMFNEAIKLNPAHARAWYGLGMTQLRQQKFDTAIASLDKAIELAPQEPDPRIERARAHAAAGRLDQGVAELRSVVEQMPQVLPARVLLGAMLAEQGNVAEAVTVYREAQRVAPDAVMVANSLAWTLATWRQASDKERQEAVTIASRNASATGHQNPILLDTLAAAQAAAGQYEQAATTQAAAIAIIEAAGANEMLEPFRARAALYKKGQPYVEQE